MKINILLFLLACSLANAQTKQIDYTDKKRPEDLRILCIEKDKKIADLIKDKENLIIEKSNLFSKKCDSTLILKQFIQEINDVFLKDLVNNYINNDLFFKETDLVSAKEDDTQKFKNENLKIKSILLVETNPLIINKCQLALNFNNSYIKLFAIRKDVLFQKYNFEKIDQAIKEIDNLPTLDNNFKLFIRKNNIKQDLEKYKQTTCNLKTELEVLIENPFQTPTFKKKYDLLKNKNEYKNYPYLIQVIEKVKNSVNNYSKNDLQPCEEVKTTTTDPVKSEGVKEGTPTKENDPKSGKQ
jgi:hypothetical protein